MSAAARSTDRPHRARARLPVLAAMLLAAMLPGTPAGAADAQARPRVVAAEAVYGDIASQIAGPDADVAALMTGAGADPHLYEPGPAAARTLAGADIAIANGAGYEPWFDRLVPARVAVLRVATLLGAPEGANPHLWVDPRGAPALARALADRLAGRDPAHAAGYRARLARFLDSLAPLDAAIAALRGRLAQRRPPPVVAATEPVLGPLLDALGVTQSDTAVQRAAMNDAEPGPASVAALQDGLDRHRIAALVFNAQVVSPLSRRLCARAEADGVPTVAVRETLPAGRSYQAWMRQTVDALGAALAPGHVTAAR